jgi:RNA polymerase sigma factor for flagellar operon FliA
MSAQIQAYQRQADLQRRDELILSHLPLVKHVAGRLVGALPAGVDLGNLESAGVLGLVEAAAKFDPSRNVQFKTFAYVRIRGAILDELRRNSPLPQHILERIALIRKAYRKLPHPVAIDDLTAATGLSVDEVTDALAAERFARMVSWEQTVEPSGIEPIAALSAPQSEVEHWESLQQLTEAIEALPAKERTAITLYYHEDLRLREIAEIMKLSVSRVSRLISRATFTLGETMRAKMSTDQVEAGC